ncbi:MAG TPA: DUF5695 domain-containing protein [Vicinamibacterales bacterium]|jgi:hypothetical protein
MIHLHRAPHLALRVSRGALCPLLATACLHVLSGVAPAQELSTQAFTLRYDESGVRSLKRANDVHDTDYIASGGALGRLLVRYRSTPNGDWRQLRDAVIRRPAGQTTSIEYVLGAVLPGMASKASPSAERGVGGLRALSDGLVPAPSGAGAAVQVPTFAWTAGPNEPGAGGPGAAASTRWVQYTFPVEEDISRAEVFWVAPPQSWRLLYQDNSQWREVAARGPYTVAANAFAVVEFAAVRTMALRIEATMPQGGGVSVAEWRVGPASELGAPSDLAVTERFDLEADALDWTITLANRTDRPVEIADLGVPLPFAERTPGRGEIYTRKLLRHSLIAGHGSWVYWQRSNGVGPYLVMTPVGQTKFEYQDNTGGGASGLGYTPYIHAKVASAGALAAGGNWRLPLTSLTIAPNASVIYAFRFKWARDFAGVRDVLYNEGKFDTSVVPGMVVPSDLAAIFALRTKNSIEAIEAEHPSATTIDALGERPGGAKVFRVRFSKPGENVLRVRYGRGQWTTLEFFVTEPLETVIRKRAAFLVSHHQHADPAKWYVGVYSDWDQKNETLRSPEDRDSLSAWLTDANDDAGNARPAFIASKNVFFPEPKEIASLELYVSKYLWGGMQMTDREKYPYAIYGIPNWKANRSSPDPGRNGQAHVWRIYDYPHIVLLYYRMYQIAKFYPDKIQHLDAATYLERAYRTAVAYWTVPLEVEKWSADAVGTMNEAFIPELIDALQREGKVEWAGTLRGYWEGKVDRFVNRTPNLYGSEFAFDSTGFESTGAFARYAVTRQASDFRARVTAEAALKFMNLQLLLNMSDRGWLETTYFQLGSDYRGNLSYLLSYMSQMGGWSILDYGLHFAADPTDYLRLGYASALSSWALVNSGTEASGYGYWFPSRNNDGATGGGFMGDAFGRGWIGKEMGRGAWHYSAEEDVGYCAALRTHATIVTLDPVFGEVAYGGDLTRDGKRVKVVSRDGLRVRFHIVRGNQRLHLVLDRDGYAKEQPISVADDLSRIEFTLENRTGTAHRTELAVSGLPAGTYTVTVDGQPAATILGSDREQTVTLAVGASPTLPVTIVRKAL